MKRKTKIILFGLFSLLSVCLLYIESNMMFNLGTIEENSYQSLFYIVLSVILIVALLLMIIYMTMAKKKSDLMNKQIEVNVNVVKLSKIFKIINIILVSIYLISIIIGAINSEPICVSFVGVDCSNTNADGGDMLFAFELLFIVTIIPFIIFMYLINMPFRIYKKIKSKKVEE